VCVIALVAVPTTRLLRRRKWSVRGPLSLVVVGCVGFALALTQTAKGSGHAPVGRRAGPHTLVRLVTGRRTLRAGEAVPVSIINAGSRLLFRAGCLALQRRWGGVWETITRTHGVFIGCPHVDVLLPAHSSQELILALYDDLPPGVYRAKLAYKASSHSHTRRAIGRDHFAWIQLKVRRFPAGSKPQLPENRILQIATEAAAGAGDPNPTLIQHSQGTRFAANQIATRDLVYRWNWSYLIAERGDFTDYNATGPPGSPAPRGSVLMLIVDASSGQVTDFGILYNYPYLAHLGPVTTDVQH
jgi:hypothetical protein